jgi:hypothetical protein
MSRRVYGTFHPTEKRLPTLFRIKLKTGSAIYSLPIDGGGLPQKIIRNPPENFYWADLSDEGKHLAWVQGKIVSNVVLLTRAY